MTDDVSDNITFLFCLHVAILFISSFVTSGGRTDGDRNDRKREEKVSLL